MNKNRKRAEQIKIPAINYIPELPITDKKDDIIESIKNNQVVIIAGETGSGKTTQIPKFCIAAGRGVAGKIGCTQPRRIAAINVAARIAEELRCGNDADQHFAGYKIRFDDTSASDTIIKVMTDGILLAETQRDPFLNEYDTIIVDEAHERSLNIDFTLGILRTLIKKRKNLKVIITSATIDTEKFSKAFNNAPIIEVSGRMYPVEVRYLPPQGLSEQSQDNLLLSEGYIGQSQIGYNNSNYSSNQFNRAKYDPDQDDQSYVEAAVEAVEAIQRESRHGDILIFMPTEQDITETIELLRGRNWVGVTVLPLYARLSAAEQAKIFHRGPGRKIIVSTNVAETSLTIPGIKYVIDTGLARIPHYSPRTRTTALPVTPISRSSADQRKGRCGRVENGICIRLYDEENYNARVEFTSPEILRSNLAEVILRMISLNLGDVSAFPFIDMPSPKSIKDGFDTLLELGAIELERKISNSPLSEDTGHKSKSRKKSAKGYILTKKGRIMARIPVDPKLSRILIEADERGCLNEAVIIASALSISDPRQRPQDKAQQADQKQAVFKDPASDFISLLNIWNSCYGEHTSFKDLQGRKGETQNNLKSRNSIRKFCKEHYLSFRRIREWSDIYGQIISVLNEHGMASKKNSKSEQLNPIINSSSKNNSDSKANRNLKTDTNSQTSTDSKKFDIGGEFYAQLHKSILAGYLGNIATKKEKNLYNAAKGQKAAIFPGSSIFNKAGKWIVAAEYVETSQLFARTAATIDVDWLEELGKSLCTYSWSSPHWEKKRGEVVAIEQVSLFGLIIVPERTVAYGKINPSEAGEIFIRHALVQGEIDRKFPFMIHNQRLIEELQEVEEKTRKRDILVTEEDIYLFYQKRLDRDFYNIRTFAKYLKDRTIDSLSKNNVGQPDSFLCMTLEDLQQKEVDEEHLAGFPDKIKIGRSTFHLEYDFNPGAATDGVTIKVPVLSAPHLLSSIYNQFRDSKYSDTSGLDTSCRNGAVKRASAIDWLVPGLFREKVMALIKNLPKSYRVKLLPASEKADIIADEIENRGHPLFYELSRFVKMRFNADIPPSVWSDEGLEPHLKMRISIRDEEDNEIASSRDLQILEEISSANNLDSADIFEKAKKKWEIEGITSWDFLTKLNLKSLPISIKLDDISGLEKISFELFPALSVEPSTISSNRVGMENSKIALRLFTDLQHAQSSHKEAIRFLFCICYENDMNALKKDIKSAARLKGYSSFFGGVDRLNFSIFECAARYLFACDIRSKKDFETHASLMLPKLYPTGQELISRVTEICQEYESAMKFLQSILLKSLNREQMFLLMNSLKTELEQLVPPDFLQKYQYSRLSELKRYIAAIKIRAERAIVDLSKDQKRWAEVEKYVKRLEKIRMSMFGGLSEDFTSNPPFTLNLPCCSKEKTEAFDELFWAVEEYKVSLFAQELKTAIKISARRLDSLFEEIDKMI